MLPVRLMNFQQNVLGSLGRVVSRPFTAPITSTTSLAVFRNQKRVDLNFCVNLDFNTLKSVLDKKLHVISSRVLEKEVLRIESNRPNYRLFVQLYESRKDVLNESQESLTAYEFLNMLAYSPLRQHLGPNCMMRMRLLGCDGSVNKDSLYLGEPFRFQDNVIANVIKREEI